MRGQEKEVKMPQQYVIPFFPRELLSHGKEGCMILTCQVFLHNEVLRYKKK